MQEMGKELRMRFPAYSARTVCMDTKEGLTLAVIRIPGCFPSERDPFVFPIILTLTFKTPVAGYSCIE